MGQAAIKPNRGRDIKKGAAIAAPFFIWNRAGRLNVILLLTLLPVSEPQ